MAPRNTENSDWQVNYPEIKMRSAHLLRSHDWTDCTFRFEFGAGDSSGVGSLDAHKLILAMASPVFAAMFYGKVGDDKEGPVHISDFDQETFARMLDYVYTDEVEISSIELAIDLFRAANKYILVHLEKRCINYLFDKLNSANVCLIYEISLLFQETELIEKCLEIFKTQTLAVLKGPSFKDAQIDTLMKIYSMDVLSIDNELDLFYALVEYSIHNQMLADEAAEAGVKNDQMMMIEENKTINQLSMDSSKDEPVMDIEDIEWETKSDDGTSTSEENVNKTSTQILDTSKSGEIRKGKLKEVVKLIRFLSLKPTEFAECKNLHHLITKEEAYALCMNISSTKTEIPIPAGFSTSRMPRKEYEDIKEQVKQIVEIGNLDSITIKNLTERIYSRYPDFDRKLLPGFFKDAFDEHGLAGETSSQQAHEKIQISQNLKLIVSSDSNLSKIAKLAKSLRIRAAFYFTSSSPL